MSSRSDAARKEKSTSSTPAKRHRARRIATPILLVFSVLFYTLAVPGVCVRRTLFDTDRYVDVVAPLAEDPAVQDYLARTVVVSIGSALGLEGRLDTALAERAPRLQFLAAPISEAVRGFVEEKVRQVFASEAFADYWERANRFVHERLIAALRGEREPLVTADGKVVLSLLPLVEQGLQAVSGVISELIGHPIQLPQLTGDEVVPEAIQRLETALGVDLPDGFGTITVYDAEELAAVQDAVDLAGRLMVLIVALFVACAAGALIASTRRRRTLVQLSAALAVVLVVERRFAIAASERIVDQARPENQAAARAVVDQVLGSLLAFTAWLLAIALVALVVALLTGPYPWAVRVRRFVRDAGAAIGGAGRAARGPGAAWVAGHRDAMMLAGAALFVVLLLALELTIGWFLVIVALLAVYEVLVYRLGAAAKPA